jgi:hypothetical protein
VACRVHAQHDYLVFGSVALVKREIAIFTQAIATGGTAFRPPSNIFNWNPAVVANRSSVLALSRSTSKRVLPPPQAPLPPPVAQRAVAMVLAAPLFAMLQTRGLRAFIAANGEAFQRLGVGVLVSWLALRMLSKTVSEGGLGAGAVRSADAQ